MLLHCLYIGGDLSKREKEEGFCWCGGGLALPQNGPLPGQLQPCIPWPQPAQQISTHHTKKGADSRRNH